MTTWERPSRNQQRRKTPSFSSSLLDAIYHSIDESEEQNSSGKPHRVRNNNAVEIEEEIASLRRAMMIEKWIENYPTKTSRGSRRVNSYSSSSTDSTFFSSSSETEKSTPKSSRSMKIYGDFKKLKQPISPGAKIAKFLNSIFNSRNIMKKHHHQGMVVEDWNSSVRKSKSVKDSTTTTTTTTTCSITSRSCLNRPSPSSRDLSSSRGGVRTGVVGALVMERYPKGDLSPSRSDVREGVAGTLVMDRYPKGDLSPSRGDIRAGAVGTLAMEHYPKNNKSKRSVRFYPVGVIVDEDSQPCGHKTIIYDDNTNDNDPILTPMPNISSHYIKKNIDSFKYEENNPKKHKYIGFYKDIVVQDEDEDEDEDDNSCTSSDLFELDNIGMVGREASREELPVYGTTNFKINQAIAKGLLL